MISLMLCILFQAQIIFSLAVLMLTTVHDGSKEFVCTYYMMIIFALVFVWGTIISVNSFEGVQIGFSGSLTFLTIFTIANTWNLKPCTTKMYPIETLVMAIGITASVAIILTEFAFDTEWDLTRKGQELFWCLFVLMMSLIIFACTNRDTIVYLFLLSLCLLLLFLYLICTYFPS